MRGRLVAIVTVGTTLLGCGGPPVGDDPAATNGKVASPEQAARRSALTDPRSRLGAKKAP